MSDSPPGWTWTTVGDVAELTDGPFGSNLKTSHYVESGPRVVRLQNVGEGVFRDERAHITDEHYKQLAKHAVRPGDVIVASLGDDAPRACLVPSWLGPAIVKADCIRARPLGGIEPGFLMWMLNSPPVRQQAAVAIKGIGRPRLGLGGIRQLRLVLAPLAEQRRIVAVIEEHLSRLEVADAEIRSAKVRLALLRRSVLDAAVADGKDAALSDLVTRIEAGRSAGGPAPPAREDEWGVIKVSAMTWGEFRPGENKRATTSSVDPRHEIRPGDLLVSRANTTEYVGAAVLVRETRPRLLLSDKSLRLVVRDGVDREWLLYALSAPSTRSQMSAVATGTSHSMRNISQEKLRAIRLRVPNVHRQSMIAAEISRQFRMAADLSATADSVLRKSAALRGSILTRAFRGDLVPQDAADEPSSVLLERIAAEHDEGTAPTPGRRARTLV